MDPALPRRMCADLDNVCMPESMYTKAKTGGHGRVTPALRRIQLHDSSPVRIKAIPITCKRRTKRF